MSTDTRTRIVKTALDLFHSQGYTATGVNDIARTAGVPKGSFYHFFDSKESLAIEAVERYIAVAAADLDAGTRVSPLERLHGHINGWIEFAEGNGFTRGCMLGNFSTEMPPQSERVTAAVATSFALWERKLANVIEAAQTAGEIRSKRDAFMLARFTIGGLEGALAQSKVTRTRDALDEFRELLFADVLV